MTNVTIIDALMGEGKTQFVHKMMRGQHAEAVATGSEPPKFIYIGMNLEESERCARECPELGMRNPVPRHGRKYWDLLRLVESGENIASTHQLFRKMTGPLYDKLRGRDYTLIIDEALDVVSKYPINKVDFEMLLNDGKLSIDDKTKCLRWNHRDYPKYEGKFQDLVLLCDNGNLVSTRKGILIWQFPASFLSAFKEVFICTYMFEGQMMADYFKANAIEYGLRTLKGGELVDYDAVDTTTTKEALAGLITVVMSDRMNEVGKRTGKAHPLSDSWYARRIKKTAKLSEKRELDVVKKNIHNFFRHTSKTLTRENMWTVFKEYKGRLKGKGYAKGFVPVNTKATNDHIHKTACAYPVNRFHDPLVLGYFQDMGVETRPDLFALTELIQWVWRSRIREGKSIHLYLPSDRMRMILTNWIKHSDAEIVAGRLLWDDDRNCAVEDWNEVEKEPVAVAAE